MNTTIRYYLGLLWPFALNLVSLLCLVYGIHLAVKIHNTPLLAWDVPLHLSYQKNRDAGNAHVRHSRALSRYDAGLWNAGVQFCGSLVAVVTLVAVRYGRYPRRNTSNGRTQLQVVQGVLSSSPSSSSSSSSSSTGTVSLRRKGLIRTIKSLGTTKKMTFSSMMVWIATIAFGAQTAYTFFGMHPSTWTMSSPIGPVSTAAIADSLGFGVWVPAAAPWDISAVMLRSAFEHVISQNGPGALKITHSHLSHHVEESADGAGVRIGRTVYPSLRTQGLGVAPAPWERKGYRVPSAAGGRVLGYSPVVAGTNVTVQCRDSTEDWTWEHQVVEAPFSATSASDGRGVRVHRYDFAPKVDWQTRGTNATVTFVEGEGSRGFYFDTWQALKKTPATGGDDAGSNEKADTAEDQEPTNEDDSDGGETATEDEPTIHQLFFFTKLPPHNPASPVSESELRVTLIDCQYGGHDIIVQVTMTSPIEPIAIGPILSVKEELKFDELIPAATAIDEALNNAGRGGAMAAGMSAGSMTSLEMWDMFLDRKLELPELIEHILTDTAQAYFSLLRQWREEALFLSWRKDRDLPEGDLTVTTNKQVGGAGGGSMWVLLLVVLGLLALRQLWSLMGFTRIVVEEVTGKSLAQQGLELKNGVITKMKKKDD